MTDRDRRENPKKRKKKKKKKRKKKKKKPKGKKKKKKKRKKKKKKKRKKKRREPPRRQQEDEDIIDEFQDTLDNKKALLIVIGGILAVIIAGFVLVSVMPDDNTSAPTNNTNDSNSNGENFVAPGDLNYEVDGPTEVNVGDTPTYTVIVHSENSVEDYKWRVVKNKTMIHRVNGEEEMTFDTEGLEPGQYTIIMEILYNIEGGGLTTESYSFEVTVNSSE